MRILELVLDNFDNLIVGSAPEAAQIIGVGEQALKQRIARGLGPSERVMVTERARVRFSPRMLLHHMIYDRTFRFGVPLSQEQIGRVVESIAERMKAGEIADLHLVIYELNGGLVWHFVRRGEVDDYLDGDCVVLNVADHVQRVLAGVQRYVEAA